jgi:quinol-cytochrome oxidoreductase complex cytochrome b subunit
LKRGNPERWIVGVLLLLRVAALCFFGYKVYHAYTTGGVMPIGTEWTTAFINVFSVPNLVNQFRGGTATTNKTKYNPGPA